MQFKKYGLIICCIVFASCSTSRKAGKTIPVPTPATQAEKRTATKRKTFDMPLDISRQEFVSFAKTLLGTRYKYGSAIPSQGLDCSGFIYYVFNHFNIKAPRSSVDFTNEGTPVEIRKAMPGDIILFTGSDNASGIVGHMGIVTENSNVLTFIHSSSGKSTGVILSPLSGYYKTHFVKIIRILK